MVPTGLVHPSHRATPATQRPIRAEPPEANHRSKGLKRSECIKYNYSVIITLDSDWLLHV